MKTKELIVPVGAIVEIAKMLEVSQINNMITGTTEEEEIIIELEYDHDERRVVSDLEEIIENHSDQEDQDEDDGD